MMIMASASGTPVPAIARLVAADEDTVRDVIHAFNERGLACVDPKWAGGRPRLISDDDIAFIAETATTRPARLGRPFTHWSIRRLADHLAADAPLPPGTDRSRTAPADPAHAWHHLPAHPHLEGIARPGQGSQAGSNRVRHQPLPRAVFRLRPVRSALDPPVPRGGLGTAVPTGPAAGDLPAHPRHPLLPRLLLPGHQLWGVIRTCKGGDHSLAALKSIRVARPDGAKICVIMDNLSANNTPPS
jgi:Homeodomain-like domain